MLIILQLFVKKLIREYFLFQLSIGDLWVNIEDLIEEPRVNDFLHAVINELGIELLNDVWEEAQEKGIVQYIENVSKTVSNYPHISIYINHFFFGSS